MGTWIASVKENILAIIQNIEKTGLVSSLRIAIVGFRDHPPQDRSFVTRQVPFTPVPRQFSVIRTFVSQMCASGGGDGPEALIPGLYDMIRLEWHRDAEKVAIVITDAPPHGVGAIGDGFPNGDPSGESFDEQAQSAREMGIIIHTVSCGGGGGGSKARLVCEKIAEIGRGICVSSREARILPDVILSSTRDLADRNSVAKRIVEEVIKWEELNRFQQLSEEESRVELVLEESSTKLNLERFDLDSVTGKPTTGSKKRSLTVPDIEEALYLAIQNDPSVWFAKFFPRVAAGKSAKVIAPGLYDRSTNTMLPLRKVSIEIVFLGGVAAEVKVRQAFHNNSFSNSIEASYKFPVARGASVNHFVAEIDGKVLVGKCLEKEKAQEQYDDAIASGSGAYLLQEVTPELFEVSVGRLPPQKDVVITVGYVAKLSATNTLSVSKFVMPTNLAPRGKGKGKDNVEVSLKLVVGNDVHFECPSHKVIELIEEGKGVIDEGESEGEGSFFSDDSVRRKRLTLADVEHGFAKDVVLLFRLPAASSDPIVITEGVDELGKAACAIDFVLSEESQQQQMIRSPPHPSPLILLLDCSSSMKKHEIAVRDAVDEFRAQASRFGCPIDIFEFSSLVFSQELSFGMFGGSEIHLALDKLLEEETEGKEGPKKVLLVTDGHLTNPSRILSKLEASVGQIDLFSIGVGECINSYLLGEMAQKCGGYFASCSSAESIRDAVAAQFRRMCFSWKNIRLSNTGEDHCLPPSSLFVAPGTRSSLFLLVDDLNSPVVIHGTASDGEEVSIQFDLLRSSAHPNDCCGGEQSNLLIHTIAARELIDMKQVDDENKSVVVDLATHYSIASKFTSFVAIEERNDEGEEVIPETEALTLVEIEAADRCSSSSRIFHPPPAAPLLLGDAESDSFSFSASAGTYRRLYSDDGAGDETAAALLHHDSRRSLRDIRRNVEETSRMFDSLSRVMERSREMTKRLSSQSDTLSMGSASFYRNSAKGNKGRTSFLMWLIILLLFLAGGFLLYWWTNKN